MASTRLEICVIDRTAGCFVCGAWGAITGQMIADIEKQIAEENELTDVPEDTATVIVEATWEPDLEEMYGGVPRVIAPGYWDLKVIEVKPLEDWSSELMKGVANG